MALHRLTPHSEGYMTENEIINHSKQLQAAGIGMGNYKTVFASVLVMIRSLAVAVRELKAAQAAASANVVANTNAEVDRNTTPG